MNLLLAIFIVALTCAVVLVVGAPLREARRRQAREAQGSPASSTPGMSLSAHGDAAGERDELMAAREAKYREIRDAELDYRTGKLSGEDYRMVDRELRAEAMAILNRLQRLDGDTNAQVESENFPDLPQFGEKT